MHIPLFAFKSAIAIALVVLSFQPLLPFPPSVEARSKFHLVGFEVGWNGKGGHPNPTLTVTHGNTITIKLKSGDGLTHQFFVDVDNNGIIPDCTTLDKCSGFFGGSYSATTSFTFTVNFAPASYTYYCSIHPFTMVGTFIVR